MDESCYYAGDIFPVNLHPFIVRTCRSFIFQHFEFFQISLCKSCLNLVCCTCWERGTIRFSTQVSKIGRRTIKVNAIFKNFIYFIMYPFVININGIKYNSNNEHRAVPNLFLLAQCHGVWYLTLHIISF